MTPASIFLTGATGTVGSDVMRRLAAKAGVRLSILIRRNAQSAEERAYRILDGVAVRAELNILEGDFTAGSSLGLESGALAALQRETTHFIHAAGSTQFGLPLAEARTANVLGARNVLDFARGCTSLECGAFLSTVYVSGRRRGFFGESDRGDAGAGFVNTYEQSKAEMEELVFEGMGSLPLIIVRLSTVIGDSSTGKVAGFNAVHHAMRLLYNGLAPMIPGDADDAVDLVSSDFVSEAIIHLVKHARKPAVFHLAAGADFSGTLGAVLGETVSALSRFRPEWIKRAVERPLIVDLDTYEIFVRAVEETDNEVLKGATRSIRTFAYQLAYPKIFGTCAAAAELAGTGISPTRSLDFYPRVVKYCLDTNWGA